jgi:hypothetical protein
MYKDKINSVIQLAGIVLPKATEEHGAIGAMGCIPDTYEWLVFKISFLEPDDLDGIIEWQRYILDKAKQFAEERGVAS